MQSFDAKSKVRVEDFAPVFEVAVKLPNVLDPLRKQSSNIALLLMEIAFCLIDWDKP